MRKGFTKYAFADDEEREYIVKQVEKGRTDREIHELMRGGYSLEQIREIRCEYFPTAGLAQYYLKSQALKMARRIVEEANVEESIDILSRPNIGVLAPALKSTAGPLRTAVMTSVQPADLGGVRVGVMVSSGSTGQMGEDEPVPVPLALPEPQLPASVRQNELSPALIAFPHDRPTAKPVPVPLEGAETCPTAGQNLPKPRKRRKKRARRAKPGAI